MTPKELVELVRPALGLPPNVGAREALGRFLRGEVDRLTLRYEWVKNWAHLGSVIERPDVALDDGEEWFSLRGELQ